MIAEMAEAVRRREREVEQQILKTSGLSIRSWTKRLILEQAESFSPEQRRRLIEGEARWEELLHERSSTPI